MHNEHDYSEGFLEIIAGPMFSGKTSKLLEIYKQCIYCNISVTVINHSEDTRYHESMLSTHDKNMIPCIQTSNLSEIWNYTDSNKWTALQTQVFNSQVILINEAQFFDDLYVCVYSMLEKNKHVYIAGLDGDFERNKFGQVADLISLCDNYIKLKSLCSICKNGTKGIFSLRITGDKTQKIIGSDNYIPVCRKCYTKETNKQLH